jgi:hypothetical protein
MPADDEAQNRLIEAQLTAIHRLIGSDPTRPEP